MRKILSLAILCAFGLPFPARSAEPPGEIPSTIPDLVFRVDKVRRIDAGHVIVVIQAVAQPLAKGPVTLGTRAAPQPPNASRRDIEAGKYEPGAMSLRPAEIIDEISGKKYEAIDLPRDFPYLGPSRIRLSLDPGSSIQMALCFNAPAPLPPDSNGRRPEQKVTMTLSHGAKPLNGLVLPPDVDSPASKKP